jgi:hypothetical protein
LTVTIELNVQGSICRRAKGRDMWRVMKMHVVDRCRRRRQLV